MNKKLLFSKKDIFIFKFIAIFVFVFVFFIFEKSKIIITLLNKIINQEKNDKQYNSLNKCYHSPDNLNLRIIHVIFTRFLVKFINADKFATNFYKKSYIFNGIRVLKKYLIPSLENQSCKDFIFILTIGDQANKEYIKSFLNFNTSFDKEIIYYNDFQNYVRNVSKGFDILITTRIDYDDRIYFDAVNDVRKVINVEKPMLVHGYNRGIIYFEENNKYYYHWTKLKDGVWGVFSSLIVILKKVNDSYTICSLGSHTMIRRNLINLYKSFGINELNYEPAIFDSGEAKFVYVRQKYSKDYRISISKRKNFIELDFNLSKFYGK